MKPRLWNLLTHDASRVLISPPANALTTSGQLCCHVLWMRRCKEALCLIDCVRHWFGFPGRLFHSRGCCDAGCRALQQWLHAPWFVLFYSYWLGFWNISVSATCCWLSFPFLFCILCLPCSYFLAVTNVVFSLHVILSLKSRFQAKNSRISIVMAWVWLWPSMVIINSISATP